MKVFLDNFLISAKGKNFWKLEISHSLSLYLSLYICKHTPVENCSFWDTNLQSKWQRLLCREWKRSRQYNSSVDCVKSCVADNCIASVSPGHGSVFFLFFFSWMNFLGGVLRPRCVLCAIDFIDSRDGSGEEGRDRADGCDRLWGGGRGILNFCFSFFFFQKILFISFLEFKKLIKKKIKINGYRTGLNFMQSWRFKFGI